MEVTIRIEREVLNDFLSALDTFQSMEMTNFVENETSKSFSITIYLDESNLDDLFDLGRTVQEFYMM